MSWAVWITGPPASGKTALARAAAELLRARGTPVRVLELDAIRARLIPVPEYSETEREIVYRSLGYMAAQLTQAGVPVIVDATAHRRRWRELARAAIPRFAEVQLLCPLDVCRERERTRVKGHPPSGIYARAGRPGATVPGVDVPYEPALVPELTIDTTREDVAASAAAVASLAERLASGTPARREGMTRWAIWITGRPGSGKTTLARRISTVFAAEPVPIAVLDLASARRFVVGREWATDRQEESVYRTLALTAQLLTEAGVAVILDATAPRRAWRELAREWITLFAEVQLVCPAEICAARERATRWHLGGARVDNGGQPSAVPDIALGYEESLYPELRLHTHAPDLQISVEEVLQLAKRLEQTATARALEKERSIT
jgi:adenylylsulfate kinase